MNKKVAIYIRVSTIHQVDKESLPFQRRELVNYAKYALGIEDYEIFEDAGYSGKNTQRPAYTEMMQKAKLGNFTHLLVWKIDRISRNLADFIAMFNELKKYNVIFLSKNEKFDTSSAIGEATLTIIMVFAELERKMTAERVTDVMISKANKGDWNGGRIPFGYDYNKETKEFSINENEARIVRLIYDYYIESKSMTKVADYLKANNFKNRNNNLFSTTGISIILNNLFYIGTYRYNYRKEGDRGRIKAEDEWITIPNHHIAIISLEQYDEVKSIKEINKKLMNSSGKLVTKKHTHIFRGMLTCVCGGNITASPGKTRVSGYTPSKYGCYNRIFGHKCTNSYISDPYLGNFVLNFVANLYKAYKSFGKTTNLTTFENKLLRGKTFDDIDKADGLDKIYACFKSQYAITQNNKFMQGILKQSNDLSADADQTILLNEHSKHKRALERLQNLYLYSDDTMSEAEYIEQKKQIEYNLQSIEKSLTNFQLRPQNDTEFLKLASCFILDQNLEDKREIDFVKLVTTIDSKIIQNFIQNMFQNFCIKNGKIIKLTLKNNIVVTFYYK